MRSGIFTIAKSEEDKKQVFGWASVAVRRDGSVVEDLQDDIIEPEELERAAYEYVLNFRDAGERHDPELRKKGKLIESVVFTREKMEAIGIPEGIVPEGWWIGFKVEDEEAWRKIKSGEYRSFSIEGTGERVPYESDGIAKTFEQIFSEKGNMSLRLSAGERIMESKGSAAKSFLECLAKFNPYHDAQGRFSTVGGAISFTFRPGASAAHDNAIAREKVRTKQEREKENPKVQFTPAKTTKEAEAFAHDALGIPNARYGKLSVDVANQMNQSLAEHFNQFPELKKQIQFVGSAQQREKLLAESKKANAYRMAYDFYKRQGYSDEQAHSIAEKETNARTKNGHFKPRRVDGDAIAQSAFGDYWEKHGIQGIAVNEKYGAKTTTIEGLASAAVLSKWNPEGTGTIKAYIDHELGHQIDSLTGARNNSAIQKLYNDIDAQGGVKAMQEAVSRYAHQKSGGNPNKYSEFVAEAWAEYRNNPNPRQTAKQVGQIIEQLYDSRGKSS